MGKDAFESYLRLHRLEGLPVRRKDYPFVHGRTYRLPGAATQLVATYHFSRYNVNTGLLTPAMVDALFQDLTRLLASPS
jgi:uracil-DNA glycosylase